MAEAPAKQSWIEVLKDLKETQETAVARETLKVQKMELLARMATEGHFETVESGKVLYLALAGLGLLPAESADLLAEAREISRERRRNSDLLLGELMTRENFWTGEGAAKPGSVVVEEELAAKSVLAIGSLHVTDPATGEEVESTDEDVADADEEVGSDLEAEL